VSQEARHAGAYAPAGGLRLVTPHHGAVAIAWIARGDEAGSIARENGDAIAGVQAERGEPREQSGCPPSRGILVENPCSVVAW
jgi:hypothetical protein